MVDSAKKVLICQMGGFQLYFGPLQGTQRAEDRMPDAPRSLWKQNGVTMSAVTKEACNKVIVNS